MIKMLIHFILCLFMFNNFDYGYGYGIDIDIEDNSKKTYPIKRAVDGTRGSKYFQLPADDSFDIYDAYDEEPDFSDYRSNIPGEPGLDYPSFIRIPQTSFTCERDYRGYYADEEARCQLFHVCDGNFLVSSFLCPVGSTFSQEFLTCDWWNKVDCSATKNFYQVNDQLIISQVDDDVILRKAYEMTSLQSTRNGIAVINPNNNYNNNDINRKLSHVNGLHNVDINQYSNNKNSPSSINRDKYSQFKYSSRYSSGLDEHDRDIDYYTQSPIDKYSSIHVDTIGKDYNNDNDNLQLNYYQASYAPTVPTVTTTTRRYYSPTVPTIIRSTSKSIGKYDLEFDSSDHLYSARGKHPSTTTQSHKQSTTDDNIKNILSTITPSTLDIRTPSTDVNELLSTVTNEISSSTFDNNDTNSLVIPSLIYQPPVSTINESINANKSELTAGNLTTAHYHVNKNITESNKQIYKLIIPNPSINIQPPFFYYSNVDQHDTVLNDKSETLIFNLTTFDDSDVASSDHLDDYSDTVTNYKENDDIVGDENSPFQLTVTLKNNNEFHPNSELLKRVIAQQDYSSSDQIRDIEIVKSDEAYGKHDNVESISMSQAKKKLNSRDNNYFHMNSFRRNNFDLVPRPFSLKPVTINESSTKNSHEYSSANINIDNNSTRSIGIIDSPLSSSVLANSNNFTTNNESLSDVDPEKTEILQQLVQTFGQPLYHHQKQVIFHLPHRERSLGFINGEPIHREIQLDEEESKNIEEKTVTDDGMKKFSVETEFVSSLGFSMDTQEERERYVDAVLHGLFNDNINMTKAEIKLINP